MSPDVASAVERLRERGILSAEAADRAGPGARGERVSVRTELQVLLYGGVLTGPRFSPGEVASPNLASDYVLLPGVLLLAADLAYVEARFTPLGDAWHFLVVALLAGALAFRYDSRSLFSLALASVAAWRGVSVSVDALRLALPGGAPEPVRRNALACGGAFLLVGLLLGRGRLKAHFEGVATHLGALLGLGAVLSGSGIRSGAELLYSLSLLLASAALAVLAALRPRFSLFALGTLTAVASILTLRFYVHLAPLWVLLTLGGLLCIGLALLLERWLNAGPARVRRGFTAEPLFEDERRLRLLGATTRF
jgi:hypothetical protein